MLPPLRPPLDPPTAQQYLDKYVPDCKRNVHIQVWDVAILFSQPWWFNKAFAINGGWWSPGFVRARIGICSKISLSTQSLNCWTGVWNKSRTIIWSTQLFRLSPSLKSMHRPALLVYCQFHLNTTLHRETTLRTALELLDTVFTTRFEANCRE